MVFVTFRQTNFPWAIFPLLVFKIQKHVISFIYFTECAILHFDIRIHNSLQSQSKCNK